MDKLEGRTMMILESILEGRKEWVESSKAYITINQFALMIEEGRYPRYSFKDGLTKPEMSFIAEVKKASPSKGIICEDFNPIEIAKEYEKVGVDCISVLTEPIHFKGCNRYLVEIKQQIKKPVLRKDFIFDEWQVYETKAIGADAMLLIVAMLEPKALKRLHNLATNLGLDVLVETHTEEEVETALEIDAKIIGVNNRNLNTFEVSLENTLRLRELVPSDKVFVAESGIHTREDVMLMEKNGVDALLIGESFMRATDKRQKMNDFKGIYV
jgi:indole-3-glycerol phosphate synthase